MASKELKSLLRSIRPEYEELYAGPLDTANYWGIAELAAAKPEDVSSAANVPGPQATTIVAAAKAERSGTPPVFYRDILLTLPADGTQGETVRKYDKITRLTLQKILDREGCDVAQDPISQSWVDFELLDLHDGMLIAAQRCSTPMDKRASIVEGFVLSSVGGFQADATEAVCQHLRPHLSSVEVLPGRYIYSVSGNKCEVDAVVIADDCAAILEAKQDSVLDDEAGKQLESCIDFIKTQSLTGDAAKLHGKKLVGFVAGRTITSDPNKIKRLMERCQQKGYGILVTSGKSLSLGNSRLRSVQVTCALRSSLHGGLRTLL